MSAYNCEETIEAAVSSILNQTCPDIEVIVCDDGSTDRTYEILSQIKDNRVKIIRNKKNLGLPTSLNKCFRESKGIYIARMDADDRCAPDRLEKEAEVLSRGIYGIVSCGMYLCDKAGNRWGQLLNKKYPKKKDIVEYNPIFHAPSMMLRECLEKAGGYSESRMVERGEDVDLWIRIYKEGYRAYNIQEYLYYMTDDREAVKRRKYRYRINSAIVRLGGCRAFHLGPESYLKAIRPALYGLVPSRIRYGIRKKMSG